jgi:hypothetical protein
MEAKLNLDGYVDLTDIEWSDVQLFKSAFKLLQDAIASKYSCATYYLNKFDTLQKEIEYRETEAEKIRECF